MLSNSCLNSEIVYNELQKEGNIYVRPTIGSTSFNGDAYL